MYDPFVNCLCKAKYFVDGHQAFWDADSMPKLSLQTAKCRRLIVLVGFRTLNSIVRWPLWKSHMLQSQRFYQASTVYLYGISAGSSFHQQSVNLCQRRVLDRVRISGCPLIHSWSTFNGCGPYTPPAIVYQSDPANALPWFAAQSLCHPRFLLAWQHS